MLQYFRDRMTGTMAFIFFGILIIPFAFVGVDSYFQTVPDNSVAKVNDQEITISDFQSSWQRYQQQLRAALGENYDPEQQDSLVARRGHLEGLINRELMFQYARELGLAVSTQELSRRIRAIQAFQIDGKFNPELYQRMLAAQGMSARQFERELADDLVISQIPATVVASSIAPKREVDTLIALRNQKRSFERVLVPAARFSDGISVDDAAVEAWYAEHSTEYMSEESVVIEYLELNVEDFRSEVNFDEEVLRKQFEQQKARFITVEQRRAAHILVAVPEDADEATIETARQKAADLAERARAGEDFADLARENSDDSGSAPNGGDLGWVEPGIMVPAFEEALYALADGGISDPVKTGFGFHVIKLVEIKPSEGMDFAEARGQLESEYASQAAEELYLEQANRLVDLIYEDPTTLSAAADELGLEIKTEGPFARGGGKGVAANAVVVRAAFSDLVLKEGASSEPVELAPNHVVVVRVKEHLPAAPKPLEEVRELIRSQLVTRQAAEKAKAKAEEVASSARGGEDLSALAEAQELDYQKIEKAGRQDFQHGLALLVEVFKLAADSRDYQVLKTGDDYAVVRLTEVIDGVAENPQEREQFENVIANSAAVVENAGVLAWLREQAEIHINESKLDSNSF